MKGLLNLKNRQAILFSTTFITSFIVSKQYTDPFFIPKIFFFFFASAVFVLMTCLVYYNRKFNTKLSFSWMDITVVSFMFFSFIRILFTPGISIDNVKFYLFLINGILYFLIKPFLFETDKKDQRLPVGTIVNILLIIALLQVFWGFLQYCDITPNLQKQFNIGGAFGNPGQYTNFITPLLSFALAVFFFSRKKNKILGLITAVAIIAILPFTQARTAWIGALFIVVYLADKKFCNYSPLL